MWRPVGPTIGLTVVAVLGFILAGCGQNSPASAPSAKPSKKAPPELAANRPRPELDAIELFAQTPSPETNFQKTDGENDRAAVAQVYRNSDPPPQHDDQQLAQFGIHKYTSKRLRLYTDIAPEKAQPLPALMDQAYDAWVEYFGALPPDREGTEFVMTGYLIGDKALFRETGLLPEDLPPFPHGRNKGVRFWFNDQPTDYYRRHLMLHEGTHCYMTAVPNPLAPHVWYMEGMAELFGTHRTDSDRQTHFRVLPHDREQFAMLGRIRLIEDERRQAPPRELSAVMNLVPNDYLANPAYAWSWGLCQFLDGHPRYQDRFRKLGQAVTTGEPYEGWQLQFATDRANLEEEWLLFGASVCHGYDQRRAAIEFRAGAPLPDGQSANIEVAADRGWQASGVQVEQGKTYHVSASGRFFIAHAPKPADAALPGASLPSEQPWECEPQGISIRYHAGRPLGMLVGAIRATPQPSEPPRTTMLDVIPLGRETRLTPSTTGTLYLRVNDDWNELADNAGSVKVQIRKAQVAE